MGLKVAQNDAAVNPCSKCGSQHRGYHIWVQVPLEVTPDGALMWEDFFSCDNIDADCYDCGEPVEYTPDELDRLMQLLGLATGNGASYSSQDFFLQAAADDPTNTNKEA